MEKNNSTERSRSPEKLLEIIHYQDKINILYFQSLIVVFQSVIFSSFTSNCFIDRAALVLSIYLYLFLTLKFNEDSYLYLNFTYVHTFCI